MLEFIARLNRIINKEDFKIVACCCGHKKYPMTVIIQRKGLGWNYELFTGESIPRKRNFYKKDKQGYYFIPEVIRHKNFPIIKT